MPVRATLVSIILLVGVLPLYFHTVRKARDSGTSYTVVCGLHPDTVENFDGSYVGVDAPPAPPGGGNVTNPAACYDDFSPFFEDYGEFSYYSPWSGYNFFAFQVTVEDLDPKKRTASARVLAYAVNEYEGLLWTVSLPKDIVLSIGFNGATPDEWKDGDAFISGTPKKLENIPVTAKPDLSFYPFDNYTFDISVVLKFINTSDSNATSFVPFVAMMEARNPAFSFQTPPGLAQTALVSSVSGFSFSSNVTRTEFTIAFSVFIFIAMWVLTLFTLVHAVDVTFIKRNRPVRFDAPAFAATLLFALPAVRQVQPGIPDVGAVIDVIGFFWAMALLVFVCCLYMTMIYAQHLQAARELKSLVDSVPVETVKTVAVQAIQARRKAQTERAEQDDSA